MCVKDPLRLLIQYLNRVNSYWVLVGVWWCKLIESVLGEGPDPLFSHIPTSTPWTPDTTGILVSDYRLEAGRPSHPKYQQCSLKLSLGLDSHETIQKTSIHLHLPLFLLSSRRRMLHKLIRSCEVFTPKFSTEHQYHLNASLHLPERPLSILVFTGYLSRASAGNYVRPQVFLLRQCVD